jgi:hypothetical protein
MRVFAFAGRCIVLEKAEPVELLDEPPKSPVRKWLTESLLNAIANDIEWRGAVELLRDEALHRTEAEESLRSGILYNDRCVATRSVLSDKEITAQFRRRWHALTLGDPLHSIAKGSRTEQESW